MHGDTKENVSGCFFLNTVYTLLSATHRRRCVAPLYPKSVTY